MTGLPDRNMFEIFSQGLFEGVKPMMVIRDHLIRHPDRCTHQAICVPICPTGAWLSTPPYKFDSSRSLRVAASAWMPARRRRSMGSSRRGRRCWSRKRRRGNLVSSRCSQSPHDKAVVARCAQSGTNQATP